MYCIGNMSENIEIVIEVHYINDRKRNDNCQ